MESFAILPFWFRLLIAIAVGYLVVGLVLSPLAVAQSLWQVLRTAAVAPITFIRAGFAKSSVPPAALLLLGLVASSASASAPGPCPNGRCPYAQAQELIDWQAGPKTPQPTVAPPKPGPTSQTGQAGQTVRTRGPVRRLFAR